jgi:squalene-hopene/tetraprenyl-beta-curcumene cyclase
MRFSLPCRGASFVSDGASALEGRQKEIHTVKTSLVLIASLVTASLLFAAGEAASWNPKAAAGYLDNREAWWQSWPRAQRDHDTTCVSCHTVLPYVVGRPALRAILNDNQPTAAERTMLAYVEKRVGLWNETEPYYKKDSGPTKPVESRGTEAVLNAFVLASYDARVGQLRDITRSAFANAWSLQLDSGTWDWLNFHLAPWETDNSQYWGTTLMAMAVGVAPEGYRDQSQIQSGLGKMRAWLVKDYTQQPLFNQAFLVWASSRLPALLSPAQQKAVTDEITALQREDGGWSLSSLGSWKRVDNTATETRSDGYATAVAMLALKAAGASTASPALERARTWLTRNQDSQDGSWPAWSLNKERDPLSDIGRFMRDSATGFASLALESIK